MVSLTRIFLHTEPFKDKGNNFCHKTKFSQNHLYSQEPIHISCIIVSREHQKNSSWRRPRSRQRRWITGTEFTGKRRVQRQHISNRVQFCSAATDSHQHLHTPSLSPDGFPVRVEQMNKKTLKHTRREICVDGGWLLLWCWLHLDQEVDRTCVQLCADSEVQLQ